MRCFFITINNDFGILKSLILGIAGNIKNLYLCKCK
jgi:hypothetical protein